MTNFTLAYLTAVTPHNFYQYHSNTDIVTLSFVVFIVATIALLHVFYVNCDAFCHHFKFYVCMYCGITMFPITVSPSTPNIWAQT